MKVLYIDCFSGISGDMTVGGLVDLGVSPVVIEAELRKLKLEDEYELQWNKVMKNGITATKFDVILKEPQLDVKKKAEDSSDKEHQHNEEFASEVAHIHDHPINSDDLHKHNNHDYQEEHHQKNSHSHDKKENHVQNHHYTQRHYQDIVKRIESARFNEDITRYALTIFKQVALAESKIHNIPIEKVHFHEVGAIDSIVDIVATAVCLDQLKPDKIVSAPVPVGTGRIQIDHGIYPVPAPATLEMLRDVPIQESHIRFELTTPTGAGIVKAVVSDFGRMPSMAIKAVGYGAGTKDFDEHPNVLRLVMGETYDY